MNFRADDFELCNLKHHWHHVLQKKNVENWNIILPWKNHSQFHELPSSSSECWQPKPSQGKLEKRPTKSCRCATGPGTDYTSMWIDFSQQKISKVGYSNTKNTALFLKIASLKSWKCHFFPSICCALAGDIQFHHLDQRIQQSDPTRQPEPIWVYHGGVVGKAVQLPYYPLANGGG